eukprot:TRINITY_DN30352_c0_g1_i1.p1 TRINITY_DN30352_c0_g1~~TRINITY_DN30352_c0_g1_i1.p1  ORF type:complete len:277 (+),score=48.08 TRINITY_DN30352_c0_g1_i1:113-943(+)
MGCFHSFQNMGQHDSWPMGKLRKNLRECISSPKGYAVILTTGGMNPLHRGHVQLLHQARQRLEEEGYGVVAMWLSPSHDAYVAPKAVKLGTIGLSSGFRIEAARRAVACDDFVEIGSWEASPARGSWPDFPVVATALQTFLASQPEAKSLLQGNLSHVQVFYACGSDHASKCHLFHKSISPERLIGVVVVPRAGDSVGAEVPHRLVFVAQPAGGEVATFSSTLLRKAIQEGDEEYVTKAMSPSAAQLLLHPSPSWKLKFAADFELLQADPPQVSET